MNLSESELPRNPLPRTQQQVADDVSVSGKDNALNVVSTVGNAEINQSRHIIYNYYYQHQRSSESITISDKPVQEGDLCCPYQGLFHFGPNNSDFFFGREVFVSRLIRAVEKYSFVPVLGASGSGKSSAVLAGLVPKLQQSGCWQFTHFRPGSEPFYTLAVALVPLYEPQQDATEQMAQARRLAALLQSGEVRLSDVITSIQQNYPNQRVLLIADQFEELYTLCRDKKTRRQFLDCLLTELSETSNSSSALVVVATMRADFLSSALSHRRFADALKADIKLGAMSPEELLEVIEKPATKMGITFESGLAHRILKDVEHAPGNLPLLEFALTELWKQRSNRELTHSAYEAIGEVDGSLARYADEQYAKLSTAERMQVRRVFIQLVRPGEGTEDTRRRATKAELGDDQWALVKQLADTRLVVTSQNEAQQETVEVVHEALIRNWGELRRWMTTDREFRAWQERLRGSMQQWEATDHDDGALLRGAAFAEAKERLEKRREDLSETERTFVEASIALQQQKAQRRAEAAKKKIRQTTQVAVALGSIALLALGASGWAMMQQQKAIKGEVNAQFLSESLKLEHDLSNGLESAAVAQSVRAGQALQNLAASELEPSNRFRIISSIRKVVFGVQEKTTLFAHNYDVYSVAFSPDGTMIATASKDNTVKLWSADGKTPIKTLKEHSDYVNHVVFSPVDSQIIATASNDNTVKIWDIGNTENPAPKTLEHNENVNGVAFSLDGLTIATASNDDTVKLWSTADGRELKTFKHDNDVMSVAFNPKNRRMIATAGDSKTAKLWNIEEGRNFATFEGHSSPVYSVAFSPDGKKIATASLDKTVRLWDTKDNDEPFRIFRSRSPFTSVAFSPDGTNMAAAGWDKMVRLWNVESGKELQVSKGHYGFIDSVVFSPDGETVASASKDNTVKLWTVENIEGIEEPLRTFSHDAIVEGFALSPDGQTIASGIRDQTIKLWDIKDSGKPLKTFSGHSGFVYSVAFNPKNSRIIASGSGDKTIKLWNAESKIEGNTEPLETFRGHSGSVYSVAFNPKNSRIIASGSGDKTIKLWNTENNTEPLKTFRGHTEEVYSVAFNPKNSQIMISGSADDTARIWNTGKSESLKTLRGHDGDVMSVAFSPNGRTVASASRDDTVKLWDSTSGELLETLNGHSDDVYGVAFSSDGQTIASASLDDTVKFWNTSGELLQTLNGHIDDVYGVAFSLDNKAIVSISADRTMKLWDIDLDKLIDKGCAWLEPYFLNQLPELLVSLEKCQEFEPTLKAKTAKGLFRQGDVFARQGKSIRAKELWEQSIEWGDQSAFDLNERSENLARGQILLAEGIDSAKRGEIAQATDLFNKSVSLDAEGISAYEWRDLCWHGSSFQQVERVLLACKKAIALEPNTPFDVESLGLAYALIGEKQKAIDNFDILTKWINKGARRDRALTWIAALKTGADPFTPEALASLRE